MPAAHVARRRPYFDGVAREKSMQKVVIIGGGHAAAQLCASLIEGGFKGPIALVCEEISLPYHRPPLSKTFIKDPAAQPQLLRAETVYQEAGIEVLLGDAAVAIE